MDASLPAFKRTWTSQAGECLFYLLPGNRLQFCSDTGKCDTHEGNVGGCSNIVLQYNGNFTIARVSREKPLKWGAEIDNI